MDSYVKSISVDVNAEENYTMVKAKQGDKINRKLAITLKKDGANFTPSGVSEIWFRVEKPDKNVVIVKSTDSGSPISVSENVYTVDLTEQCLTASGEAWCDIAFLDDSGNTLSSAAFVMKIIPMPNGDSARSSSAWTDLQNAIDNIEAIVQEQLQPAIDDAERFADILAFRVNDGYIQYTVDSETWINLMPSSSVGSPDSDTVPNRSSVSGETVSQALNWLKNNSGATSDDITNESTVTGQTVTDALDNLKTDKAPLDSPEFTGTPTSTTPASTDNSTKIATTAFIKSLLSALTSGDISDGSSVGGSTVEGSFELLKGSLNSFQYARGVSSTSDFGTESFNFSATADITLSPSSFVLPKYAKGVYVTSGADAVLIAVMVSGQEIIAYRNGSNWQNANNINSLISTVASNVSTVESNLSTVSSQVAPFVGTQEVSTEAQLVSKNQFFQATANISLGSTGVTLEQYARGVTILTPYNNTGCIIAIGYAGRIYSAFIDNGAIVRARTYYEYSDQASTSGNFTPTMLNCTPNYTTRWGYYRRISRDMLYVRAQMRGTISAVGSPAYSIIDLGGFSALEGFSGSYANVYIREGYGCCVSVPFNAIASDSGTSMKLSFQTQEGVGTTANSWKTTDSTFYIDIDAIFIRPN